MFELEIELFQTLIPLLIAVVTAIYGYWEHKEKRKVEADADYLSSVADLESQKVAALTSPGYADVATVKSLSGRAWQMSEATKKFLTAGAFAPFAADILRQVADAEEKHQVAYRIYVPNGVQYVIEYGLLKEQVGNT